jgi:hypothetical protein
MSKVCNLAVVERRRDGCGVRKEKASEYVQDRKGAN